MNPIALERIAVLLAGRFATYAYRISKQDINFFWTFHCTRNTCYEGWWGVNPDLLFSMHVQGDNVRVERVVSSLLGELSKMAPELSPTKTKTDIRLPPSLHYFLFYNKANEVSVTCFIIVHTLYLTAHYFAYTGVWFSLSQFNICTPFCIFFVLHFRLRHHLHF